MNKTLYRYIEAELYDYHHTVESLMELRAEIIERSSQLEMATVSKNNKYNKLDPTESKAIKLLTNRRLKKMVDTVEAIERVYNRLPPEKQQLVKLFYWNNRHSNMYNVLDELHIEKSAFYKWKKDIITAVAIELGLTSAAELECK